jgi:hypothetical protein
MTTRGKQAGCWRAFRWPVVNIELAVENEFSGILGMSLGAGSNLKSTPNMVWVANS